MLCHDFKVILLYLWPLLPVIKENFYESIEMGVMISF